MNPVKSSTCGYVERVVGVLDGALKTKEVDGSRISDAEADQFMTALYQRPRCVDFSAQKAFEGVSRALMERAQQVEAPIDGLKIQMLIGAAKLALVG